MQTQVSKGCEQRHPDAVERFTNRLDVGLIIGAYSMRSAGDQVVFEKSIRLVTLEKRRFGMRPQYDAIVIGSGFGGAVAGCRLAQAGLSVGILERGRSYPKNSFPRNWNSLTDGWLWRERQGLFDIRPFQEMTVVQGAGLGGGSLIYANVHLRAPEEVFANAWPAGYTRAALDPYYDLVAYMLDINPITKTTYRPVPTKTKLMEQVAKQLHRSDQFCFPNIAVNFAEPEVSKQNKFGADQEGCRFCGECDIGCNYHAKNTLDLNYLTLAQKHDADITTLCEVTKIEPSPEGYAVEYRDHSSGGVVGTTRARYVFVCAGAVNSTELLLRCQYVHKTLPNLSERLGYGYSGNGDFLAFAFNTRDPFRPSEGPTITTGIVYDREDSGFRNWFIFQEGGYPKEVGGLLQLLNPHHHLFDDVELLSKDLVHDTFRAAAAGKAGFPDPRSDETAIFLAMGRDLANGIIRLSPITNDMKISWDTTSNLPLYNTEKRFADDVATAMGGDMAMNPLWRLLHIPVSVHNLGGCLMADSPQRGLVNAHGEVYGYPGLFVLDGAILPKATGVNPSHTIAAVAEQSIEAFIRRATNNSSWRAPEAAKAVRIIDPLLSVKVPPDGTPPTDTQSIGIAFTETMKGHVAKGWTPKDDYHGADQAGQKNSTRINFTLDITIPDLDSFLAGQERAGIAVGKVRVDGFTPETGVPVTNGVFNLFVEGEEFFQRRMLYALPFVGDDGKSYLLDGFKDVRDHGHFDVWRSTSTLYTVIREGHSHTGTVLATGIVTIHIPDFLHQVTTFKAVGASGPLQRTEALARFGKFFFGTLWDVFVRPHFE